MRNSNTIPHIAIVGKIPAEYSDKINELLAEDDLADICATTLYDTEGRTEKETLVNAITDWQESKVQGIVCLPFETETEEMLQQCLPEDAANPVRIHVNRAMKMASVMGNTDISEAAIHLTQEQIISQTTLVANSLRRDFLILNPRIAVTSLNAEIDLSDSSEEIGIISPAINELSKNDILIFGPVASGTILKDLRCQAYDALMEIYDSQCINDFTMASNEESIVFFSNIQPPVAAAGYDGILQAIYTVIDVTRNRLEYDYPRANSLPKLYHERKEDGDKARFAVKKKGFNPAEHRRENVTYTTTPKTKNASE